jgi:hypothetical protein
MAVSRKVKLATTHKVYDIHRRLQYRMPSYKRNIRGIEFLTFWTVYKYVATSLCSYATLVLWNQFWFIQVLNYQFPKTASHMHQQKKEVLL